MAYASITYTSASGTTFALTNSSGNPIQYLRQADISVTVNGVLKTLTTDYTFNSAGTAIVLNTAVSGATVVLSRTTSITDATVSFTAGSTLTAQDLNNSDKQNRFALQEFSDIYDSLRTGTGDLSTLGGFIGSAETWLSDNSHAATTGAIDGRVDSKIDTALTTDVVAGNAITITDNSPSSGQITVAVTNGAIETAELADGAVTTAKIADGNVTTAKILDSNVTTAKLNDAAVTTAKLANDSVTSAKIADGTIIAGDLANDAVTTAKILDANVTTAKIADSNVTTAKINNAAVTEDKLANSAVTNAKIASGAIDSTKLSGATVVTNAEVSGVTVNDTSFFTTSASDLRYFRQDSSEAITSGDAWSSSDSYVATTAAIDARIIDLVDDVGGFVPIANETSFPATNPDINNPDGTGTIISIKEIVTTRTPSSGTVTIANGSGSNTVTINGCGSTVLASGFGVLVETTSTLHTYTFHRLVPKATEVTTVAGISTQITTVSNNVSDITTVANDLNEPISEIETVAGSIANVNAVGGSIANVNTVASNLTAVNSFANLYRIASSDPTTSLDTGDLVFNTTSNRLRIYNGTAWQDGVTATGDLVSKTGDTMTGALGITSGSAGSPSLFISGDTNTGIYSPGADQVAISTNGTGRLFIDASGNVGIGGTASNLLHLRGTTANLLRIDNNHGTSNDYGIEFYSSRDVGNTPYVTSSVTSSHGGGFTNPFLKLSVADSSRSLQERLRIDSSGRLGLGTSTPSSYNADAADLVIGSSGSNGLTIVSGTTNNGNIFFADGTSGNDQLRGFIQYNHQLDFFNIGTNATSAIRIDSSQRVGIGSNAPNWNVTVQGSSDCYAQFVTTGTGTTASDGSLVGVDGSSNLSIRNRENAVVNFFTQDIERARIDSSGRLLVGTSSSSSEAKLLVQGGSTGSGAALHLQRNVTTASAGSTIGYLRFANSADNAGATIVAEGDGTWSAGTSHPTRLVFSTTADGASSPTERMRITNTGRLNIARTSDGTSAAYVNIQVTSSFAGICFDADSTSARTHIRFNNGNGNVGFIETNGSSTVYSTSSDYRLKENIVPLTGAIDRINQLQVHRFNFIANPDKIVDGFIAHEAQAVVPECVTGTKDEVDDDGNPVYQGIDQSKLVPLLTAALQETIAELQALKAEVAALKGA